MRTDLSAAFIVAKNSASRSPRQLAVFHFPIAGDLYISDQALGAVDGLSHEYGALIEDWGELLDMAGGDPQNSDAAEIRQLSLTIWNGGAHPFSDYFMKEDPENILVDLYQWFDGLSETDLALIDTFVIQDPIEHDEAGRLLRLDLVSLSMRYDNPVGAVLNANDWPNAQTEDIGKGIDIVIGSPGKVPTVCAKTAPMATLNGSILANTLTVNVNGDLDALGFTAAGTLQIGEEKMRYSSRTSSAFTIIQRGYLSTATEHIDRDEISQVIADYTYLVGKGPIGSISSIKVAGFAPPAIFTAYPALDPARIVFSEKPYSVQYVKGSSFLEMQFDAINADNSAWQAHLAYDTDAATAAALVSPTYKKLSLRQATVNPDRGQIVKAYLAVEHWAESIFLNDYVEVSIPGIGVLGRLSRPNPDDLLAIDAEVDIDHGHSHQIGGDHIHPFQDPSLLTNNAEHGHESSGIGTTTNHVSNVSANVRLTANPAGGFGGWTYVSFSTFPASFAHALLTIRCYVMGGTELWFWPQPVSAMSKSYGVQIGNGERQVVITSGATVMFAVWTPAGVGGYCEIYSVTAAVTVDSSVLPARSQASTTIAAAGEVNNNVSPVKAPDDVNPLATANATIQITASQTATHSVVNLFDVTSLINFSWAWFTNRDITIEYKGTAENKNVYILHAFWDVEYRKREIVFSDDVTCEPQGLIDDGAGTYTGAPAGAVTRPDHVRKYLLCSRAGLPETYINAASFAAAGARYDALGYVFDGVLPADMTVRNAEKKLARQCRSRFFWNAGAAKIALREMQAEWSIARALTRSDIRLKSISSKRGRVSDLVNTIRLFYGRDWTAAAGGSKDYAESVFAHSADSVVSHGVREKRDGFLFDMVSDSAMAADLLAFYLEISALPSIFYTLEAYLPQMDLEKEDIISVISDFARLNKARMAIRAADRIFASGKTRRMNAIRIVAECLRYLLIEHTVSDAIQVADALTIELGLILLRSESITLAEALSVGLGLNLTEAATVADALTSAMIYLPSLAETAIAAETLAARIRINTTDTVTIGEFAYPVIQVGFGAAGFGESGFGGQLIHRQTPVDIIGTSIELAITEAVAKAETAIAADALYFGGDGFGGAKFSVFGQSLFGV